MGISVYIAIIGLLLTINERSNTSIAQRLDCIPAQYCGLVWSKRLPCCESAEFPKCGLELKFPVNAKIYSDDEAVIGEFPWIGQIFYQKLNTSECIGSLITQRFLLSAAHCVAKQNIRFAGKPIFVRLGEHNTSSRIDCVKISSRVTKCSDIPIDIKIISFVSHPKFIETSLNGHNDIAILKLDNEVAISDFINTICLPSESLNVANENLKFVASGWGETRKGTKSRVKLKVVLPSYDFTKCSELYKKKSKIVLNDGQICAGGDEGQDTCRGDSGGPLMLYNRASNRWVIVGVVSFGSKRCGSKSFPAVYVNVKKYLAWITNNTKD